MGNTNKRINRKPFAPPPPWDGVNVNMERMDRAARQRYLERRLIEVEAQIEAILRQREENDVPVSLWDVLNADSELWQEAMDLSYLEASRHAIMQTLADLGRPARLS